MDPRPHWYLIEVDKFVHITYQYMSFTLYATLLISVTGLFTWTNEVGESVEKSSFAGHYS